MIYKLEIFQPNKIGKFIKYYSSLSKAKLAVDEFCKEIDMVVLWSWKGSYELGLLEGEIYSVDETVSLYNIVCKQIVVE